jgi:hypothetical protein
MARTAAIAATALVLGLVVGFLAGRREASEAEPISSEAAATQFGCEGEFSRLMYSVMRDMRRNPHSNSRFPILMREKLAAKGYSDPENEVIDSLLGRPDLIPYPGVLGGTMAFRGARVPCSDRVLAEFDDGHYGGVALLAFDFSESGEIEWRLVYAEAGGEDPVKPDGW